MKLLALVVVEALLLTACSGPEVQVPAACRALEVKRSVTGFVDAFNAGDQAHLEEAIAKEPIFEWYSVSSPPGSVRMGDESRDRSTLLEYFRERNDLHERLTIISIDSKYESRRRIAHLVFRLKRVADDFKLESRNGKGALDCKTGSIIVWSM